MLYVGKSNSNKKYTKKKIKLRSQVMYLSSHFLSVNTFLVFVMF